MSHIVYKLETELEDDGRWIAEIPDLPGVLAYGATEKEAIATPGDRAPRTRRSN